MATKTIEVTLGKVFENGTACANPVVKLIDASCVSINCIDETKQTYKVQLEEGCDISCLTFSVSCGSCKDCPPQIIKKCFCDTDQECTICETCGASGFCEDKYPNCESCDEATGLPYDCGNCPSSDCEKSDDCRGGSGADDCACIERRCRDCQECVTSNHCPAGLVCATVANTEGDNCRICVDCATNEQCDENEQCTGFTCECKEGYKRDSNGDCTLIPPNFCQNNSECDACSECLDYDDNLGGGTCQPKGCPTGYIAVPNGTTCVCLPECDCATGGCVDGGSACAAHPTEANKCYCHACAGDCTEGTGGGGACGPTNDLNACICSGDDCVPNPCRGTCDSGVSLDVHIGSGACGGSSSYPVPNDPRIGTLSFVPTSSCGCYNNQCTPCEALDCDQCAFAVGCACLDGTCQNITGDCNPDNVSFALTKVPTTTTPPTNNGCDDKPVLNAVSSAINKGVRSHNGAQYNDAEMTFSVSNLGSDTGTWYIDHGTGENTIASNQSSITISTGDSFVRDNLNYFQIIFRESDGCRVVIFDAFLDPSTDPQNPVWTTSTVSSRRVGGNGGGSGVRIDNYLCLTNSNYDFADIIIAKDVVQGSIDNQNNLDVQFGQVTNINGAKCVKLTITGCGTWQGKIPLKCRDNIVYVDTPVITTEGCCDPTIADCTNTGTPCDTPEVVNLELVAHAMVDGNNGHQVRINASRDFFRRTFKCQTNFKWSTSDYVDEENNITYSGAEQGIDGLDQAGNNQFTYVNFGDNGGGCVNLSIEGCEYCKVYKGQICINECTDLDYHLEEVGNTIRIYVSTPVSDVSEHFNFPEGTVTQIVTDETGTYIEVQKSSLFGDLSDLVFSNNAAGGLSGGDTCSVDITENIPSEGCTDFSVAISNFITDNQTVFVDVTGGNPAAYTVLSDAVDITATGVDIPNGKRYEVEAVNGVPIRISATDGDCSDTDTSTPGQTGGPRDCDVDLAYELNDANCSATFRTSKTQCQCSTTPTISYEVQSLYEVENGVYTGNIQIKDFDIDPIDKTIESIVYLVQLTDVQGNVLANQQFNSVTSDFNIPYDIPVINDVQGNPDRVNSVILTINVVSLELVEGCSYNYSQEIIYRSNNWQFNEGELIGLVYVNTANDTIVQAPMTYTGGFEKPYFYIIGETRVVKEGYGEPNTFQLFNTEIQPGLDYAYRIECDCTNTANVGLICFEPVITDIAINNCGTEVIISGRTCLENVPVTANINGTEVSTTATGDFSITVPTNIAAGTTQTVELFYTNDRNCKVTSEASVVACEPPSYTRICDTDSEYTLTVNGSGANAAISIAYVRVQGTLNATGVINGLTVSNLVQNTPISVGVICANGCTVDFDVMDTVQFCNCNLPDIEIDSTFCPTDGTDGLYPVKATVVGSATTIPGGIEYSTDGGTSWTPMPINGIFNLGLNGGNAYTYIFRAGGDSNTNCWLNKVFTVNIVAGIPEFNIAIN